MNLAREPMKRLWIHLGLLAAIGPVLQARADGPVPSDPVFIATLTDGSTVQGRIARLESVGTLTLDGPNGRTVHLSKVFSLVRQGTEPPPSVPEGPLVLFPDGDRLRGIIGATTETALDLAPGALGDAPTEVPLDSMLAIVLSPPSEPEELVALLSKARSEARDAEALWLANGDRLIGSLLGMSRTKVDFQPDTGPLSLPRSSVIALGFDPRTIKYPRPEGTFLELTFNDGSRLGVSSAQLAGGKVLARTRFGLEVRPDLKSIARIHVRGDAIAYLSERDPDGAQFVGYLGRHPQRFGRNSTWDGQPLRLGGQPYDRGLGTLPRTLLAYKLDERDQRFQATIGLDERAGPLASVVFRVLVDGEERLATPALTHRDAPRTIDVNVAGGKYLILATEFGDRGDVQDVADWAEARLVR